MLVDVAERRANEITKTVLFLGVCLQERHELVLRQLRVAQDLA